MPKKVINISKFKQGIHNKKNARDIPEDAIADGLNIMTDVEGKTRQMARDRLYPFLDSISSGHMTPGYGLFTFRSDNAIKDNIDSIDGITGTESTIIVYQLVNQIGFYTIEDHGPLISLGEAENGVKPSFYYSQVDGALRVCDSNYDNFTEFEDVINYETSNVFTKYFKFMNKTWFPDLTGDDLILDVKGWINGFDNSGLHSFIYPPTVLDYTTAIGTTYRLGDANSAGTVYNLVYEHATDSGSTVGDDMAGGNITIQTSDVGSIGDADWLAQTLYKFGVSFVYEGGQESQVTNFVETFGDAIATDGNLLGLKVFVHPGEDGSHAFDPRITGCNIYLCGDDSGLYEDPYFLAAFYWGSSSTDKARLTTSDGNYTEAFSLSTNGHISNTNAINIIKTPVITYSMRNGFSNDSKSVAINYKTAVIANRRCYAANVRRYSFDIHTIADSGINGGDTATWKQPALGKAPSFIENDTMIVSPVDKYDIFPESNTLNIGSNDGDHIVLLMEYADRILQFKQNTVYVINISEDIEYVEQEFEFYGIQNPYQVIKTDEGIVWVNNFGCYLYNGEEIQNLIDDKLQSSGGTDGTNTEIVADFSWDIFGGGDKMVGYIPKNKQIVVFSSPNGDSDSNGVSGGNILIYDMLTESWAHGFDRLPTGTQSNSIIDFDGSLIYAMLNNDTVQEFVLLNHSISHGQGSNPNQEGQEEVWIINGVSTSGVNTDDQGSQLLIGSTPITDIMNYPDDAGENPPIFSEYLMDKIVTYNGTDVFDVVLEGDSIRIKRLPHKIDGTYTGQSLAWSTTDSMGAPFTTTGYGYGSNTQTSQYVYFSYQDNSDAIDPYGAGWSGTVFHSPGLWDSTIENGFEHSINIAWDAPLGGYLQHRYAVGLIQHIGYYVNIWGSDPFYVTNGDAPTLTITKDGGGTYTDASGGSFSVLTVDLYSDHLFDNRDSLIVYTEEGGWLPAGSNITGNVGSFYPTFGGLYGPHIHTHVLNENLPQHFWDYADPKMICVFYNAAPKVDGSGETDSDASGAALKQWADSGVGEDYYYSPATLNLPTMIWVKGDNDTNVILIPGNYGERFIIGGSYTFANTGQASNNQTYVISSVDMNVYDPDATGDGQANMHVLTILTYVKASNSSFFDNVKNWSTRNTVTSAGAVETIVFGTHSVGSVPRKREIIAVPKFHGASTANVVHSLSVNGSDNKWYYSSMYDQRNAVHLSIGLTTDLLTQFVNRSGAITPWWDIGHYYLNLPVVRGLFCANGVHVTTASLTDSDTTPFDVTLGTGVTAEQIVIGVKIGTLLLARSGSVYEVMRVTAISGTTITVSRNYLNRSSTGSAVAFGTVTIQWYKTYVWKQISSSQFEIWGDDYTSIFVNDVIIKVKNLNNDSGGGNAYSDTETKYVIKNATFDSDNGKTIVNILTTSYDAGTLTIATSLAGTNGSAYFGTIIHDNVTDRFATNMGGDEPGNESTCPTLEAVGYTGPDRGTTLEDGAGIAPDNLLFQYYGVHLIENLENTNTGFSSTNINSDISTGIQLRTFSNDISEGLESSAGSFLVPSYLKTREIALNEDDLFSRNVFYEVQITYRCSQDIYVTLIANGQSTYDLSIDLNDTTNNVTGNNPNIEAITIPIKQLRNLMHGSGSTELVIHSQDGDIITSSWITRRFFIPTANFFDSSSYLKNVSTVQFIIYAPPTSFGFEINDISVVFRPLEVGR